jgi:hypothetical protein
MIRIPAGTRDSITFTPLLETVATDGGYGNALKFMIYSPGWPRREAAANHLGGSIQGGPCRKNCQRA